MDRKTFKRLSALVGQKIVYAEGRGTIEATLVEVNETSDWVEVEEYSLASGKPARRSVKVDRILLTR